MAQDLKITAVVKRDPWSNDYGKYQTYAVQFDKTGDTWIQWNKKFKGDEEPTPPQTGDEVFGDVANGKFKIGKKDGGFTPNASSNSFKGSDKKEWIPRDDDRIVAQWAIGQAVQLMLPSSAKNALSPEVLEDTAKMFYQMVDRVKGGEKSEPSRATGYEAFKAAGGQVKSEALANEEVPVSAYDDVIDNGDPIDVSQIPF